METTANWFLIAGAASSALAAALHVGCIAFGAPWYRFFGAGERMAQLAAAGSRYPALITAGIASVLIVWSLYALSGADLMPRLPLLRTALCLITAIYLLRGIAGIAMAQFTSDRGVSFWWSSS